MREAADAARTYTRALERVARTADRAAAAILEAAALRRQARRTWPVGICYYDGADRAGADMRTEMLCTAARARAELERSKREDSPSAALYARFHREWEVASRPGKPGIRTGRPKKGTLQ